MSLPDYLKAIQNDVAKGNATEHTHRPALKTLIESLGNGIIATNEPKRVECGAPDFIITRGEVPLGYIEAKDVGVGLDKAEQSEQLKRYRESLGNLILTDYLEFRWIGTQDIASLNTRSTDEDADELIHSPLFSDDESSESDDREIDEDLPDTEAGFKSRAGAIYELYATELKRRFKWLRSDLFLDSLKDELLGDAAALMRVLKKAGAWNPSRDAKLIQLFNLIANQHPDEKVIVFSQFADTVHKL